MAWLRGVVALMGLLLGQAAMAFPGSCAGAPSAQAAAIPLLRHRGDGISWTLRAGW